jgi:hypothetical protein
MWNPNFIMICTTDLAIPSKVLPDTLQYPPYNTYPTLSYNLCILHYIPRMFVQ